MLYRRMNDTIFYLETFVLFQIGIWILLSSNCVVKAQIQINFTEENLKSCYSNLSKYNVETVPVEWVVQDVDEKTIDKHTTVNWTYTFDEGTHDFRGFMVRFTAEETTCKLMLMNESNLLHGKVQFQTLFTRKSTTEQNVEIDITPVVREESIEYKQWNGLSFLNIKDHDIKVICVGSDGIKSMTFYLYRKQGDLDHVDVKSVYNTTVKEGAIIVVKNLTKGLYHYELNDIVSVMSGNCPCYVKVLGKKQCRQCKGKKSDEFCILKICTTSSSYNDQNTSHLKVLVPVTVVIVVLLVVGFIFCYIYRFRLICYRKMKYDINSRLIVWHQPGSVLHDKVVRRFATVLQHMWHVDVIEDDNTRSRVLYKYDRSEIFKILIFAGGHGTRKIPQRYFNSTTDCSSLLFLPMNWSCRPIIVSYSETQADLLESFPTDLEKYDLSQQMSDLINHLYGCEMRSSCMSKLSIDMKRLGKEIRIANATKENDVKHNRLKTKESFKTNSCLIDERFSNFNFIPSNEDTTSSLYNDIIGGINVTFEQSGTDGSMSGQEHHESISIGGKSV